MKKGTALGYKYCRDWELLWQAEHLFITFSSVLFSVAHDKESELLPVQTMLSHKHNTILLKYLEHCKAAALLWGSDRESEIRSQERQFKNRPSFIKKVFCLEVSEFILCEHKYFKQHEGKFWEKLLVVKQSALQSPQNPYDNINLLTLMLKNEFW